MSVWCVCECTFIQAKVHNFYIRLDGNMKRKSFSMKNKNHSRKFSSISREEKKMLKRVKVHNKI